MLFSLFLNLYFLIFYHFFNICFVIFFSLILSVFFFTFVFLFFWVDFIALALNNFFLFHPYQFLIYLLVLILLIESFLN
jgi:hypothetical protein